MRVKFLKRYNAWFEGADPEIDADLADRLIKDGYCKRHPEDSSAPAGTAAPPAPPAPASPAKTADKK